MKWVLKNFVLLTIIILIAVWAKPVLADSTNDDNTQTNSSGSNMSYLLKNNQINLNQGIDFVIEWYFKYKKKLKTKETKFSIQG